MPDIKRQSRLISRLASLEVALAILIIIAVAALPGTFISGRHAYYGSWPFILLLTAFAANLLVCTLRRWRQLSASVLLVHLGILLALAGFVVREIGGTVATINLYEGEPVNRYYLPYQDRDVNLGFSLLLHQVKSEYFPVPIKIGVMKGGEKLDLHMLRTGESFAVAGYRVVAESIDPRQQVVQLSVYAGEKLLGRTDTEAEPGLLSPDFPYSFKLVAFQNPVLRRSWVDLQVDRLQQPPVRGKAEVNSPFKAYGFNFYHVQNAFDDKGRIYAGIQLVRDPGRPFVFMGMSLAALGTVLAALRRRNGVR